MLFWGTILSSTLRAGPSTSEVKRHKVLSTSKSLALFCSGLVILLANEASEAIRHEYRVPGGARAAPPLPAARRDYVRGRLQQPQVKPPPPCTGRRRRSYGVAHLPRRCSAQRLRARLQQPQVKPPPAARGVGEAHPASPAVRGAGDAHAASHIRSATFGKQLQYLLQKQQPTSAAPHT